MIEKNCLQTIGGGQTLCTQARLTILVHGMRPGVLSIWQVGLSVDDNMRVERSSRGRGRGRRIFYRLLSFNFISPSLSPYPPKVPQLNKNPDIWTPWAPPHWNLSRHRFNPPSGLPSNLSALTVAQKDSYFHTVQWSLSHNRWTLTDMSHQTE